MGHPTFILRLFALLSALLVTLCGCLVQPTGGTFDNLSMGNWGNGESYSGPACGPGQECPRPGPSQAEFVPGYTCPTEDGELSSPRAYLHKYTLNSSSFYRLRGDECSDPEETEVVDASEIFGNGYRLLAYRGRIFYEHGGSWEPLSEPEPGDFPFGPPTGRYVEVWCHLSRSTLEGIGLMILDDGTAIVAETRTVGGEWKRRFSQKLPVSRTEASD